MSEPASETNPVLNPVPTLCSPCARSVRELVLAAVESRVVLTVEGGALRATGPRSVADLGRELMARKVEVLEWLGRWQPEAAHELVYATDGLVADLGVSGRDEVILSEAGRCAEAVRAGDTLGVVNACRAIQALARDVARGTGARAA